MKKHADLYPVYLFYGPEDFLMEEEIERLLDRTLSPKERGLNLHVFSAEEHSAQEIAQTAQTLPMFSRYRFVLVKEADQLEDEKVKIVLRYIENPSPARVSFSGDRLWAPGKDIRSRSRGSGKWLSILDSEENR